MAGIHTFFRFFFVFRMYGLLPSMFLAEVFEFNPPSTGGSTVSIAWMELLFWCRFKLVRPPSPMAGNAFLSVEGCLLF